VKARPPRILVDVGAVGVVEYRIGRIAGREQLNSEIAVAGDAVKEQPLTGLAVKFIDIPLSRFVDSARDGRTQS